MCCQRYMCECNNEKIALLIVNQKIKLNKSRMQLKIRSICLSAYRSDNDLKKNYGTLCSRNRFDRNVIDYYFTN